MTSKKLKQILVLVLIILIILSLVLFYVFSNKKEKEIVRQPAVAGSFYPANKKDLSKKIDSFLSNTQKNNKIGKPVGFVLPHAGYRFSGQVIASGLKQIKNKYIKRVVILANSHKARFKGASVFKRGYYKTPLGKIRVDSNFAKKIINLDKNIKYRSKVHKKEHSIEVELPFLQKIIKKDFKIVPIVFGNYNDNTYKVVADFLSKNYNQNTIFIASSDLSHYPDKELAKKLDQKTINSILSESLDQFNQTLSLKNKYSNVLTLACGNDAIKALMIISNNLNANSKLLQYKNSSDITNQEKHIVGYGAIGFFINKNLDFSLNENQKQTLLNIARTTIQKSVNNKPIPEFRVSDPILKKQVGVFVTLKKQGRLRGCIGRFSPTKKPLFEVVKDMAIAAAKYDNRFQPVQPNELSDLNYEISVLSPMEEISNLNEISLGKDGVYIQKGNKSGVFLPQVATDNNWGFDKFMSELCFQKAGLNPDCYKDKDVIIKIFTAQVF